MCFQGRRMEDMPEDSVTLKEPSVVGLWPVACSFWASWPLDEGVSQSLGWDAQGVAHPHQDGGTSPAWRWPAPQAWWVWLPVWSVWSWGKPCTRSRVGAAPLVPAAYREAPDPLNFCRDKVSSPVGRKFPGFCQGRTSLEFASLG